MKLCDLSAERLELGSDGAKLDEEFRLDYLLERVDCQDQILLCHAGVTKGVIFRGIGQ